MPKGQWLAEANQKRSEKLREQQLINYVIDANGCWIWQGKIGKDGYGQAKRYGETIRAPRMFYQNLVGPIPEGLWVLHHCDNPACVNPEHLYTGTQLDNERDKDVRGRRPPSPSITHPESIPRGKRHHRFGKPMPPAIAAVLLAANKGRPLNAEHKEKMSPLTAEQVIAIRSDSRAQHIIAHEYGVCQMTISRIKTRKRWTHI